MNICSEKKNSIMSSPITLAILLGILLKSLGAIDLISLSSFNKTVLIFSIISINQSLDKFAFLLYNYFLYIKFFC